MKIGEAIKEAMVVRGMRFMDLAKQTGLATNTLANRLNGDRNISLDKVDEMLHVIGYKMVIMPEEAEMCDGWYEVDSRKFADEQKGD